MATPLDPAQSVNGDLTPPPAGAGLLPMLVEVFALCGYGLWMLLGLALALGIYTPGRGDALVPLALGCAFVSAGLLAACLRLRALSEWHGWRISHTQRPTREALLALATYLPMLGLAGLVRGSEHFWVIRVVSMVLALGSLACLISGAHGYRLRRLADQAGVAAQLPASRVLSACYGGGLWLWVCLIFQTDLPPDQDDRWPWAIGLLLLAMLLGLIDRVAWQSLRGSSLGEWPQRSQPGLPWRRFLAALLICAIPSLSLLMVTVMPAGRWLAPFAAAAYIVGKSLELWLYDFALRDFALSRSWKPSPVEPGPLP